MSVIDKSSAVPYYQQLADLLRREIQDHVSSEDSYAFPSEHELCARHGITRTTVRHALDVLEAEGRIYRQKGKGTFVAVRRVEQDATQLVSTTEDMRRRGWRLDTRVLCLKRIVPPPVVQDALELREGEEVYRLVRLRLTDGEPLSLQASNLPMRLCPDLDDNDLSQSLYALLESRYNLRLWTARQVVRARGATRSEAELLQVSPGDPLLYAERVTYTADGQAVEHLEAVWRGDRYDLTVVLSRPR